MGRTAVTVYGREVEIGVPVFRWDDKGGFDGYTTKRAVWEEQDRKTGKTLRHVISGKRYQARGPNKPTQFLVHHSGGDGRNPSGLYETLWNVRDLSVQYALEDDGRVYQFLDSQEMAWHAGGANRISVGCECCLRPDAAADPHYYDQPNKQGNLPHAVEHEVLQGVERKVFVMPDVQVDALARLIAGNWVELYPDGPAPKWPRVAGTDAIPTSIIEHPEAHVGIIGHLHWTTQKWDPAGLPWYIVEQKVAEYFDAFRRR